MRRRARYRLSKMRANSAITPYTSFSHTNSFTRQWVSVIYRRGLYIGHLSKSRQHKASTRLARRGVSGQCGFIDSTESLWSHHKSQWRVVTAHTIAPGAAFEPGSGSSDQHNMIPCDRLEGESFCSETYLTVRRSQAANYHSAQAESLH